MASLVGIFKLMSYNEIGILDGIFSATMGVILFVMARMVSQAKVLALTLCGLVIAACIWYSFYVGSFSNTTLTITAALWFFWLYGFWKKGELK